MTLAISQAAPSHESPVTKIPNEKGLRKYISSPNPPDKNNGIGFIYRVHRIQFAQIKNDIGLGFKVYFLLHNP